MLRLKAQNVHQALECCYRLLSPNVGGRGGEILGGGSRDSRIDRQLDMAVAARVLGFVDKRLPDHGAQMIRFCYSSGDTYADYAALTLLSWERVQGDLLSDRAALVREGISSLRLLAPWEARYRIFNPGESQHTGSKLAELLGINRSSFARRYQDSWDYMVNTLLDAWSGSSERVEGFINDLVEEKNVDGKPLKISNLGSLSKLFSENFEKAA